MNKNILLILGLLLLILIGVIIFLRQPQKKGSGSVLRVGSRQYEVEIADTLIKQAKGLSGRDSLAPRSGMLFVFATSSLQSFWMQGMRFPLDFIWINQGLVIGITENVPFESQTTQQRPPSPADMVLEVAAGTVARDGLLVGNMVELDN